MHEEETAAWWQRSGTLEPAMQETAQTLLAMALVSLSLVVCLLCVGMLCNAAIEGTPKKEAEKTIVQSCAP